MDRLPFFELEELLDSLKDLAEKEEEERKKKEGKERGSMPNFNVNSMMSRMNSGSGLPSPSMPNLKI